MGGVLAMALRHAIAVDLACSRLERKLCGVLLPVCAISVPCGGISMWAVPLSVML